MLRKIVIALVAVGMLSLPATAAGEVSRTDFKNASKYCKALKAEMGATLFKQTYGTNKNRSNAHGKCVSKNARVEDQNHSNASKECKAERAADAAAFAEKYGTGKTKRNALGRCISGKVKQLREEHEDATVNAAKKCKAERAADRDAFRDKYGTNRNKRNAFGKCVSKLAKEELENNS